MADGELTLKLDDETVRRLKAAADAAGQPVGDYAARVLAERLDDSVELDESVEEDLRRLEEYDRTGEYVSVEEAMSFFRNALEERLSQRK